MAKIKISLALLLVLSNASAGAVEIGASKVAVDLEKAALDEGIWKNVREETVSLMAQPMALPRPKTTETSAVRVQVVHDGRWVAFRLRWRDDGSDQAGRLGQFSDAVAIQFPVKEGPPPPVFMGGKDSPVHIFHWRAQYQADQERGKPEMKDLYPNMNPDMYPMEFKDPGQIQGLTEEKREIYAPGKAEGNPQSYAKASVDEIFAEGFGSSSVIQNRMSFARGTWKGGEWSVILARPLKRENGSSLEIGKTNYIGFAVWQGGKQEVGSRKSVTMAWTPLLLNKQ